MRQDRPDPGFMHIQSQEVLGTDGEVIDPRQKVKCRLFADAVRQYGSAKVKAMGGSMLPAIRPGDLLTIESCSLQEVSISTVVAFIRSDRIFVHRVVENAKQNERPLLVTRGDALDYRDDPVGEDEFLGKITGIQRSFSVVGTARRWLGSLRRAGMARLL